jgi:hypothetical protein
MSKDRETKYCEKTLRHNFARQNTCQILPAPLPMTWACGANGLSGQVCCCASKEKQKKRKNMSHHLSIINSALSYLLQSFF